MFKSRAFRFAMILVLVASTSEAFAGGRRCRKSESTCVKPCQEYVYETITYWVCRHRHHCTYGAGNPNKIDADGYGMSMLEARVDAAKRSEAACKSICLGGTCTAYGYIGECEQRTMVIAIPVNRSYGAKARIDPLYECTVTVRCCDGSFHRISRIRAKASEACCEAKADAKQIAHDAGCRIRCWSVCVKKICISM